MTDRAHQEAVSTDREGRARQGHDPVADITVRAFARHIREHAARVVEPVMEIPSAEKPGVVE